MPTTITTDFATRIQTARTRVELREIADEIGMDLLTRPHTGAEHAALTDLRIQALDRRLSR